MPTIVKQSPHTSLGDKRHPREGRQAMTASCFGVRIFLLGLMLVSLGGCAAPERKPTRPSKLQLPESKVVASFRLRTPPPAGIVAAKGSLWLLDAKAQKLTEIDPESGRSISSVEIGLENPRGLAWDGTHFWCGDDKGRTIRQFDASTGKLLRSVNLGVEDKAGTSVLEGIAFDNKQLWAAYAAGYSSMIYRIDAATGEVIQSMFANCHPRGITTDGKRLWVVCYNRGLRPSMLSVRTIMDDAGKMNASKIYISKTPGLEPMGIAFDGQHFWLTDKKLKMVQKIMIPSPN